MAPFNAIGLSVLILSVCWGISIIIKSFKPKAIDSEITRSEPIEERINDIISDLDDLRDELADALLQTEIDSIEGKIIDRQRVLDLYLEKYKNGSNVKENSL